uniref:G-protein coupled receptors family 1 profile domain-containing protein n=1 Tax=Romanomermis culicivorax TaxID=13658 RepID=A0A915KTE0_ROMCU
MYMAMDVCASTASILNLVAISWDRYIAVSRPMLYARKAKKLRSVVGVIISIWIISIFIAVPMITGLNKLEDTEHCEFTNATYIVASSVGSFFLPCVAILILYTVVLKTLQSRQRLRRSQMKKHSSTTTVCSLETKTFVEEGALGTSTVSDEKEVTVYTGMSKSPHHDANGIIMDDTIINLG